MGEESWVLPEIPEPYWDNEVRLRCRACAMEFETLAPNGDEVVKLRETGGTAVKWLPTYGSGGIWIC